MTVRDHLARKGIEPLRIERTNKRGGHLVLGNSSKPAVIVTGRKGSFRGYLG